MKRLAILILALGLIAGCHKAEDETAEKPKKQRTEQRESTPSDQEQIENEVREGGLKDPGGAKSVRDEAADQQKEQQDQANQADQ